jgi:hypothetical protein
MLGERRDFYNLLRNKKLNLGATLEMSILKKEKEFKWISCPGSGQHPIREQGAACREIIAYEWNRSGVNNDDAE